MAIDCKSCPYKMALELLHPHLKRVSEIAKILENGKEIAEAFNGLKLKSCSGSDSCSKNK